jgi:hypothetical protein
MRPEQVKAIPFFQDLDPGLLERVHTAMFEVHAANGQLSSSARGSRPKPCTASTLAR